MGYLGSSVALRGKTVGRAKHVDPACLDQIWGRDPLIDPDRPLRKRRRNHTPFHFAMKNLKLCTDFVTSFSRCQGLQELLVVECCCRSRFMESSKAKGDGPNVHFGLNIKKTQCSFFPHVWQLESLLGFLSGCRAVPLNSTPSRLCQCQCHQSLHMSCCVASWEGAS